MAFKFIELETRERVGWFRFNRPPVNAIDWEMLDELVPALRRLLDDPAVRVMVIASAQDRYFSAGADMSSFRGQSYRMPVWIGKAHALARTLRDATKPVLAAINGVAVGGGLEMALHADLRFASRDARLGQPEVNIGFVPPIAGTQSLVRLIGRSQAFAMLYGGELVSAERALSIGLVDFVCETETLGGDVQAYAEILAAKPANALSAIRRCLVDGGAGSFEEGLAIEGREANALAAHPNFEEGVRAFMDKREPEWR